MKASLLATSAPGLTLSPSAVRHPAKAHGRNAECSPAVEHIAGWRPASRGATVATRALSNLDDPADYAPATTDEKTALFLSDLLNFESERRSSDPDPIIERASAVLTKAREALNRQAAVGAASSPAAPPAPRAPVAPPADPAPARESPSEDARSKDDARPPRAVVTAPTTHKPRSRSPHATRVPEKLAALRRGLTKPRAPPPPPPAPSAAAAPADLAPAPSSATEGASGSGPEPMRALRLDDEPRSVLLLEREGPQWLELRAESDDLPWQESLALPPFQSVIELTTASQPPARTLGETENKPESPPESSSTPRALSSVAAGEGQTRAALHAVADGRGMLADGTKWEKVSGEEFGENGYWKRWYLITGTTSEGVRWEECTWEVTDWAGMKQLGAKKSGRAADGSEWTETWEETFGLAGVLGEPYVERTARKWCKMAGEAPNEWEEQWGELSRARGATSKWAHKWAHQGDRVWHERWGEDYRGEGSDHCVKWTDRWAEHLNLEGQEVYKYGDKWREEFEGGKGEKRGEVWNTGNGGYRREWGEDHYGGGKVRKFGHSNKGEHWDQVEQMNTYYNPVPHFGYRQAIRHSHVLLSLRVRPRDDRREGEREGAGAEPEHATEFKMFGTGINAL